MSITIVFGALLVFVAVLALTVPNKLINTSSCKRNWMLISIILIGATLIIGQTDISLNIICVLFIGIFVNYAFPFLLNVIDTFNRKTDP